MRNMISSLKILVINGEPFNSESATGITMSSLFCEWSMDDIFQVYTANISPDLNLCRNNFRLSSQNL
jgi:hypothetical protein